MLLIPQVLIVMLFLPAFFVLEYRVYIFSINIISSTVFAWIIYKKYYHMIFEYDQTQFSLKQGSKVTIEGLWSNFKKISLVRTESGDVSIRLYSNGENVEIPVSKVKINPFKFRTEVTSWMKSRHGPAEA